MRTALLMLFVLVTIAVSAFFVMFGVAYITEIESNSIPEGTNFTLYVTNQSTDHRTINIKVMIDEKLEIDRAFDVGNQHQVYPFYFKLSQGVHTIQVDANNASYEKEFTIDDELWMAVAYWYDKDDSEPPTILVDVSDGPIGFQ